MEWGGPRVSAQASLPVGPAHPAPPPHLPGLQLLRQRHLLADGAKQLPGEGVSFQRDAAELQGQFQNPVREGRTESKYKSAGASATWVGWVGGSWTRAGVGPLTMKPRSLRVPGSEWGIIIAQITREA